MNNENLIKAKELTEETFVLLKNKDNILPIKENLKIALIGPYVDNIGITGSWSMFSDRTKNETLLNMFKKRMKNKNLYYAKGSDILRVEEFNKILKAENKPIIAIENEEEYEEHLINEAIQIAQKADIIILAVGEHYKQSGEACSRSNISLPENQIKLINELSKLKIPIVMILFNGRPLQLNNIEPKLDAILEVWFPGTKGAEAITEILFGDKSPSGKLTMSFTQSAGRCPIHQNHYNTRKTTFN